MPSEPDTTTPPTTHRVVVNDEEQYSIWPVDRECPPGWRPEGTSGTREQCLAHIDAVWTDITPLSVRRAMAGRDQACTAPPRRDQACTALARRDQA